MDNGLVQKYGNKNNTNLLRLNPCCSGLWSRTLAMVGDKLGLDVLILVVVDDGLVLVLKEPIQVVHL